MLYALYQRLSQKFRVVLGLFFIGIFVVDATYSAVAPHVGKGITYR